MEHFYSCKFCISSYIDSFLAFNSTWLGAYLWGDLSGFWANTICLSAGHKFVDRALNPLYLTLKHQYSTVKCLCLMITDGDLYT